MNFTPSKSEIVFVREALERFNEQKVGSDFHEYLNIVEYDSAGNVIGGLLGGTYWGWLHVDILWVEQTHRKKKTWHKTSVGC